jgi:hypothetical protein
MSRIDRDCGFDGLFIFAGGGPQPFERRSWDGPYAFNVEDNQIMAMRIITPNQAISLSRVNQSAMGDEPGACCRSADRRLLVHAAGDHKR